MLNMREKKIENKEKRDLDEGEGECRDCCKEVKRKTQKTTPGQTQPKNPRYSKYLDNRYVEMANMSERGDDGV